MCIRLKMGEPEAPCVMSIIEPCGQYAWTHYAMITTVFYVSTLTAPRRAHALRVEVR